MSRTELFKVLLLTAFTVDLAVGRRIPASSPTMWGLVDKYGKYYLGKVVGQEDDLSGVYFYANIKKQVYFIMNDEFFDQRLAMDVDPRPDHVHVGSAVLFEFTNYNIGARYLCHIWETKYSYKISTGKAYYTFLLGSWRQGQEANVKDWKRTYLRPQWVGPKDMYKMRLVNIPRETLCSHLEINCKSNEKCVLLDEFLPLVGCKHKTFRPRTISPNIPTTQHPTTRPPTLPPATLPPKLSPIIHPPTIPTKYKPPGKTATESDKQTQNESPSGGQHTDQYVPPEVEEIYEDDKKWLATLLPVMFIGGAVVVIACLVTCVIRYIKQRKTTQQNDSDTEAQLADKKKVKKRRKHKDKDTKQSSNIRRKKRKKRKMEKFDEVTLGTSEHVQIQQKE